MSFFFAETPCTLAGLDWQSYTYTESTNHPSVTSELWEPSIIDAAADWCIRGVVAGPYDGKPKKATLIKMTVREKSNGRAR